MLNCSKIALGNEGIEASIEGTESTMALINASELGRIKVKVAERDYQRAITIARSTEGCPEVGTGEAGDIKSRERGLWIEVISILSIAFVPVSTLSWWPHRPVQSPGQRGFLAVQLYAVGQAVFMAIPVLYILALNEKKFGRIPIANFRRANILQGLLVACLMYVFFYFTRTTSVGTGRGSFFPNPTSFLALYGLPGLGLTAIASLCFCFTEELVFRAYLISRAGKSVMRIAGAILFSATLYAIFYAIGARPATFP